VTLYFYKKAGCGEDPFSMRFDLRVLGVFGDLKQTDNWQ